MGADFFHYFLGFKFYTFVPRMETQVITKKNSVRRYTMEGLWNIDELKLKWASEGAFRHYTAKHRCRVSFDKGRDDNISKQSVGRQFFDTIFKVVCIMDKKSAFITACFLVCTLHNKCAIKISRKLFKV